MAAARAVASLIVTVLVERETLTSVWCFFAAILSAQVLVTVRRQAQFEAVEAARPQKDTRPYPS